MESGSPGEDRHPKPARGPDIRVWRILGAAAFFLYVLLLQLDLQFSANHILGPDGYYHTRYSNLLPQRGLSREFPWTEHSLWRFRFSDKEFLFHVLLIPFCRNEASMVLGGKAAMALLAFSLFVAFFLVCLRLGLRWPFLWTFLLLSAGLHFQYRLVDVRPQVLSIGIAVIGTYLILGERPIPLMATGFVYAWSYVGAHVLIALAGAAAFARWLAGDGLRLRLAGAAAAGVLLGTLFHPYFPQNVVLWYVQNVMVPIRAWGLSDGPFPFELGSEFAPVDPRVLMFRSTLAFFPFLLALLAGTVSRKRLSARSVSLAGMSLASMVMLFLSARFIEYFAPLALLFSGSVATDLLAGYSVRESWRIRPRSTAALACLAVAVLAGVHVRGTQLTRERLSQIKEPAVKGAALWIRDHLAPGEKVLNLNWSDFPALFHFAPRQRYIVGLDPTFMSFQEPEAARYLGGVQNGALPIIPAELARTFQCDYLVIDREDVFLARRVREAGLRPVFLDARSGVFVLRP